MRAKARVLNASVEVDKRAGALCIGAEVHSLSTTLSGLISSAGPLKITTTLGAFTETGTMSNERHKTVDSIVRPSKSRSTLHASHSCGSTFPTRRHAFLELEKAIEGELGTRHLSNTS